MDETFDSLEAFACDSILGIVFAVVTAVLGLGSVVVVDDLDADTDAAAAEGGSGEASSALEVAPVPPRVLRSIGMILLL